MSGSTGERSFADIITSIRYWVIHSITTIIYTFPIHCGLVIRKYGFSLQCVWKSSTKLVFHREPRGDSINN